jgi:hypothetical protein
VVLGGVTSVMDLIGRYGGEGAPMGIGILGPQIPVAILKGQVPPSAEFTNNYTFALAVMACKVRTVVSRSWTSNWLSRRTEGPLMYSRRLW